MGPADVIIDLACVGKFFGGGRTVGTETPFRSLTVVTLDLRDERVPSLTGYAARKGDILGGPKGVVR
jgi:hypothetical protein